MNAPTLKTIESLRKKRPLLLYFSAENCQVCTALKTKLIPMIETEFPKLAWVEVEADKQGAIAAHYGIFSAPTAILFFEGREFERFGRNVGLASLQQKIGRIYTLYFGEDQ